MSTLIPIKTSDGSVISIHPAYNIRFLFPRLVGEALVGLQESRWEDWYKDLLKEKNITEEDLLKAWKSYSSYMLNCLDTNSNSPLESLENSGFTNQPRIVQVVILAKIGQLLTAALWWPLREGTMIGYEPSDVSMLSNKANDLLNKVFNK